MSEFSEAEKAALAETDRRHNGAIIKTKSAVEKVKRWGVAGIPPQQVANALRITLQQLEENFAEDYCPQVMDRVAALAEHAWERALESDKMLTYMLDNVGKFSTAMDDSEIQTNQELSVMGTRQRHLEELQRRRQESDVVSEQ